jgi:hypothetical protein
MKGKEDLVLPFAAAAMFGVATIPPVNPMRAPFVIKILPFG